ncbi:TonB family protein [Sphingosinithalassobacter sp. LHW66-3]|uniref:TonB family protein n=1 Tax=Sphingosinithalassobacter sp. LHW66-3 TaxID=3424718 RepID=UPI003D6A242B
MLIRRFAPVATLLALALPAQAQEARPMAVISVPEVRTPVRHLVTFQPGVPTCEDGDFGTANIEQPFETSTLAPSGAQAMPIELRFGIAANGRPVDIRVVEPEAPRAGHVVVPADDVVPSFAAWQFISAQPRTSCRIRFEPVLVPYDAAPPGLIARYLVLPHRALPEDRRLFQRLHGEEATCLAVGAEPRTRAYPPFSELNESPGGWSYATIRFSIDDSGHPYDVTVIASDASPEMQAASRDAVARSRFAPRAATGCTYPYYLVGEVLQAPPRPELAAFEAPEARCEGGTEWAHLGQLTFPRGFQRRKIEGWALMRFDVTPEGVPTNIEVVRSEPAAAFGEQAVRVVRQARQAPQEEPKRGCLDFVRFVMPDSHAQASAEAD